MGLVITDATSTPSVPKREQCGLDREMLQKIGALALLILGFAVTVGCLGWGQSLLPSVFPTVSSQIFAGCVFGVITLAGLYWVIQNVFAHQKATLSQQDEQDSISIQAAYVRVAGFKTAAGFYILETEEFIAAAIGNNISRLMKERYLNQFNLASIQPTLQDRFESVCHTLGGLASAEEGAFFGMIHFDKQTHTAFFKGFKEDKNSQDLILTQDADKTCRSATLPEGGKLLLLSNKSSLTIQPKQ